MGSNPILRDSLEGYSLSQAWYLFWFTTLLQCPGHRCFWDKNLHVGSLPQMSQFPSKQVTFSLLTVFSDRRIFGDIKLL